MTRSRSWWSGNCVLPPHVLGAGLAEHPQPDLDDDAGLLGQADELRRRQQPSVGVVPADEGLDREHLARRHLDLGLVVDDQLAVVERLAQLDLVLELPAHLGPQRLVEDLDAIATELLGRVHGRVGVAQQVVGVLRRLEREGDPDAGRGGHLVALDVERAAEGLAQLAGHRHGLALAVQVLGQDHQLVAAHPGQQRARRAGLAAPVGPPRRAARRRVGGRASR